MLYIIEMARGLLAARAFRLRASKVGVGSSEQAVRQALGEPNEVIVNTDEDGKVYVTWRYKNAFGQRTDFNIGMVEGKWSYAWRAYYPGRWPEVNEPKG